MSLRRVSTNYDDDKAHVFFFQIIILSNNARRLVAIDTSQNLAPSRPC